MSIQLKLQHEEGIRLRQQTAQIVERNIDGAVVKGTDWKFNKFQDAGGNATEDIQQDLDPRRVGSDGRKVPLGTYTVHATYNQHNLVIERKGKIKSYDFKNPAIRNQMRVKYQTMVPKKGKDGAPILKDGKPVHVWEDSGQPQYVPPNSFAGAMIGDGVRVILDELPT